MDCSSGYDKNWKEKYNILLVNNTSNLLKMCQLLEKLLPTVLKIAFSGH